MSGIINKVKDALHTSDSSTTTPSGHTTTTGHHTTGQTVNDGYGNTTTGTTGTSGYGSSTGGVTGTHGTTGAGPHSSSLMNKLDPTVDSQTGATTSTTGTGYGNTTGSTGHTGYGSSTGGVAGTHAPGAGPHSSTLANKLDPRVDSQTGSTTGNVGTTTGSTGRTHDGTHLGNNHGNHHTGTSGGMSTSTNAGPHDSNVANKLDPRVDSDLSGRGNRHGAVTGSAGIGGVAGSHATPGSGTAQNTAGPHNSDLLNKLDPRVDSDRDGSATVGGNRTHT